MSRGDEVDKLVLLDMKAHCPGKSWDEPPQMEEVEDMLAVIEASGRPYPNKASESTAEKIEEEKKKRKRDYSRVYGACTTGDLPPWA
jgi:hypothetical protein